MFLPNDNSPSGLDKERTKKSWHTKTKWRNWLIYLAILVGSGKWRENFLLIRVVPKLLFEVASCLSKRAGKLLLMDIKEESLFYIQPEIEHVWSLFQLWDSMISLLSSCAWSPTGQMLPLGFGQRIIPLLEGSSLSSQNGNRNISCVRAYNIWKECSGLI